MGWSFLTSDAANRPLILGEFRRAIDERWRLSLPPELVELLPAGGDDFILAKECCGALSLWDVANWQTKLDAAVRVVQAKIEAGKLDGRIEEVQRLGRLLSTRHRTVQLAGRGRITIPESFREYLGVEPGGEVLLVGAAICVEIWRPDAWLAYLEQRLPDFGALLGTLSG